MHNNTNWPIWKTNRFVLFLSAILIAFFLIGYTIDVINGRTALVTLVMMAIILFAQLFMCFAIFRRNQQSVRFRYFAMAGFTIAYCIAIFSSSSAFTYVFIFPVALLYVLYEDVLLIKFIAIGMVLINGVKIWLQVSAGYTSQDHVASYLVQGFTVLGISTAIYAITRIIKQSNAEKTQEILGIWEEMEGSTIKLGMLTTTAEILMAADEDEAVFALMTGMEIIGRSTNSDRVLIWLSETIGGEQFFVMQHDWVSEFCMQAQSPQVPKGQKLSYNNIAEWLEIFTENGCINSPASEMPPKYTELLRRHGTVSTVCVPMFNGHELIGFLSIDDMQREKTCSGDEMRIFASAGLMFASVFNRMEQAAAIKRRDALLQASNQAAKVLLTAGGEISDMDALMEGMAIIGRLLDIDRAQIWQHRMVDGEFIFVLQQEWLSEIGKQKTPYPINYVFRRSHDPQWADSLLNGESVNSPVHELPRAVCEYHQSFDVVSTAIFPLISGNEIIAFFSVQDCRQSRRFNESEMDILASAGLKFASMFNRTRQAEVIKHRGTLLQAVNEAAAYLLTADADGFESVLQLSMRAIGKAANADRVYIWKNHTDSEDGRLYGTLIHEWINGIEPDRGSKVIKLYYDEFLPEDLLAECTRGGCINGIARDFPIATRKYLAANSIVSVLLMPLILDGEFWGFVGFDDCYNERVFADEEQAILRSCGLLFVSATLRNMMLEEIKDTSEKLEEALDEAKRASKAKGDFLSNMSHEMRTPMNAIIGMSAIGLKSKGIDEKDRAFGRIDIAATHLLGVINDILDMAKIEADKMELMPVDYTFDKMIQRVLTLIRYHAEQKEQILITDIDSRIPQVVFGDEQRLTQAITNVLSNAVKFTHKGGNITLNIALVEEEGEHLELRFEVIDTGVGIPAEKIGGLFNAFEQVKNELSHAQVGTGLGLAITKRIVEMMSGRIWAESEVGVGTTISFSVLMERRADVDVDTADDSNTGFDGDIDDATYAIFEGKHLLLVEDMEVNREILEIMLEDSGLIIDCAENGKIALDKMSRDINAYDIILMDVLMPEMNGLEATRRIRELGGTLPIIALTANVFKDDIEECLAAGMDDHLGKPFEIGKVIEKLRKYLRESSE